MHFEDRLCPFVCPWNGHWHIMGKACSGGFLSQCLENHLSISISASLFIAEGAKLKSITSFPFGQSANKGF